MSRLASLAITAARIAAAVLTLWLMIVLGPHLFATILFALTAAAVTGMAWIVTGRCIRLAREGCLIWGMT
jgi:hypothetical protein